MAGKKNKLFGTDGIRGRANKYPMTPEIAVRVGQAIGLILRKNNINDKKHKVVIGKDTRLSGYMIELALASGLNSMGVHVLLVGPLPTPGIGFLVSNMRADAGIVISASHNPYHDNGIKIFDRDGFKMSDEIEDEIDLLVSQNCMDKFVPDGESIGRSKRIEDSQGRYIVFAKSTFPLQHTLDGLRIVLDCANGAAYKVAPAIFEELGAELIVIGNRPNGLNINDKVGALYPDKISEAVRTYRADVGISLDGDADRVMMADETGQIINGDHVLGICALQMEKTGRLPHKTIVATQMSNFGLEKLMNENGIKVVRTDVGDKYVVREMKENGYVLGGEQSGHIIFLDHSTTGDGLIAALCVLAVMKETKSALSELHAVLNDVPQVLINTRVTRKKEFKDVPGFNELILDIETKLKGEGRTFIRYSGTEPIVRVLVEGPDKMAITEYAEQIANLLQTELS